MMTNVKIKCPTCGKEGFIDISEDLLKKNTRGILAVNIINQRICPHSFIIYIDKNLVVRDSILADFKIELPEIELEQKIEEKEIPDKDIIDIYLITINLNILWLTNIIRACIFKKKILILNDIEILNSHIINFFNFIFQNSFDIDISLEKKETYKKNKKYYKDYIVIDDKNVYNDKKEILLPKLMKIERIIVQKFLAENNPKTSLIIIRNEILKAYELAKSIIRFKNDLKEKEEFTSKKIIDYFKETRDIKISIQYLNFLIEIVTNYFEVELSMSSGVSDFLGF